VTIVFDTNVLFAAFVTSGLCAELYETARDLGAIRISESIAAELRANLVAKAGLSRAEADAVLAMIGRDAELVALRSLDAPACRDADDDWILATALSAEADCIVTGDKDLLVLQSFHGIPILDPRRCLEGIASMSPCERNRDAAPPG